MVGTCQLGENATTNQRETDADLKRVELRLTDPYEQEGLVERIPDGEEPAVILNTYEFERYPAEKAWCAICKGHRHQKGVTCELTNGDLVLVGSKCASDRYGKSWRELDREHKARWTRQTILLELDTLAPRILLISKRLLGWKDTMRRFEASRARFQTTMSALFELTQDEARRGSELAVHEQVRGSAFQQHLESDFEKRQPESVRIVLHMLRGREYFSDADPVRLIDNALALLSEIAKAAEATDAISNKKMSGLRRSYREMVKSLQQVRAMHGALAMFFAPDNLSGVARWASQASNVPGNYHAEGRKLVWEDQRVAMEAPPEFPSLDLSVLELLDTRQPIKSARRRQAGS